ncbi:hypothetical protein BsWGS_25456 [Bradybaena similaris]
MDDFQKDRANFHIQNKDSSSEHDGITMADNECTHCTNNKLGYIRHSISQDLLPNVSSDGCSRCRCFNIGLEDTRSAEFWRACFTEFLATLLLCFYHIAIIIFGSGDDEEPPLLHISIGHGLFVAAVVTALGETSGCHMNPAVTIAFASLRQVGIIRTMCYVVSQCAGAVAGSILLREVSHPQLTGNLGVVTPGPNMTVKEVLCTEIIITAFMLVVVMATSDKRRADVQISAPLIVGLTVIVNTLLANKVSGSCMNPARAMGPAVVRGEFTNMWVYWLGPCCGALLGAHLYNWVLAPGVATLDTARVCCSTRRQDEVDNFRPAIGQIFSEGLPETRL